MNEIKSQSKDHRTKNRISQVHPSLLNGTPRAAVSFMQCAVPYDTNYITIDIVTTGRVNEGTHASVEHAKTYEVGTYVRGWQLCHKSPRCSPSSFDTPDCKNRQNRDWTNWTGLSDTPMINTCC